MNSRLFKLILRAIALGTGVSTVVLSILGDIDVNTAILLIALGLTSLAMLNLQDQ